MTAPFRGALIGCGFFARNHMEAWTRLPDARIVAVCDTDRTKAETFARDFRVEHVFTDAAEMLAAIKPDFCDIATTVASHRPLVELAARHSGAVICQKPFAETLDDGRAMVAACENAGVPLLVHENFRWQRPIRELRRVIDQGRIGTPRFLRLSFRHAYDIYANQPYLLTVQDLALTDIGLHMFDMVRFLMGDATRVHCETQKRNPRVAGQDAFVATLRHTSGAVSSVECSFFSQFAPDPFPQSLALLEGDDGSVELLEGYRMRLHGAQGVEEFGVEPPCPDWGAKPWHLIQDSVAAFESHVVDVLKGQATPQPSGAHNLETLALTLAAIRSAATGQAVDLTAG